MFLQNLELVLNKNTFLIPLTCFSLQNIDYFAYDKTYPARLYKSITLILINFRIFDAFFFMFYFLAICLKLVNIWFSKKATGSIRLTDSSTDFKNSLLGSSSA